MPNRGPIPCPWYRCCRRRYSRHSRRCARTPGEADGERVAERHVDIALGAQIVEALVGRGDPGLERLQARRRGVQVDRPGQGVAAVQRALRPLQHFKPRDVEKGTGLLRSAWFIHAVDENADDRAIVLEGGVRIGTANGDLGIVAAERERQAGGDQLDSADIGDASLGKPLSSDRLDRQRHVLDVFRPLLRRDDDVLEPGRPGGGSCRSRIGRRCRGRCLCLCCSRCRKADDRDGQQAAA